MKNLMRKMMAMLLAVMMLMSSVPFTVFAEEPMPPAVETPTEPEKKPEAPAEKTVETPKAEEKAVEPSAEQQKEESTPAEKSKEEQSVEQSSETQKTEQENTTPEETQAADPTKAPDPEGTKEPDAKPTSEPTAAPSAEATQEATAEPTTEVSIEPSAESTADATVDSSATPSAEPTIEPTTEPSVEPTIEPTTEPTVEPTPEVTVSATPEASTTPEITATPEVTPEATLVPKIKFTAPEDGDIVPGQEDLKVEWEIEGNAEGLLFSARDLQRDLKEEDSFIYQESVSGNKYEISGADLPYDTDVELWIGVTDASGNIVSEDKIEICTDSEPVIEEPENTEEPEDTAESSEENAIEENEMPVAEDVPLFAKSFSLRAAVPAAILTAPQNLVLDGYYLSWDEVEGAEYYIVEIEELGEELQWGDNYRYLSNFEIKQAGTYTANVYAANSGNISEASTIRFTVPEEDILRDLVLTAPKTHPLVTDLQVSWNDIGNVDQYSVYLQDPNWEDIYWDVIWDGEVRSITFPKEYFTTAGIYRIRIEASGEINSSTAEIEVEVIGDNSSTLPAPQNLAVSVDCVFTWDAVEDAEVYEVYLNDRKIGSTSTCVYCFDSWRDFNGQTHGEYTAAVCAVSSEGVSEKSEVVFEYEKIVINVPETHTVNTPLEISWTDIGLTEVDFAEIRLYHEEATIYNYGYYSGNHTSHMIPAEEFSAEGEYRVTLWTRTEGNHNCSWNAEVTFQVISNGEQLAAPVIHDIDAVLDDYYLITWDAVPNATSYQVDYVYPDGDTNYWPYETTEPQHYYSCEQVGNASITVTALAPGYISSTATKEFTVRAFGTLEAPQVIIEGLSAENTVTVSADLKISWNEIENADEYQINLESENNNWGTNCWDPETTIDAEYLDQPGEYTLTVTAEKDGWISGETTITFTVISDVDALPAPTNIALDENYCLTWDAVPGAEIYYILFEGLQGETTGTAYDLKEHIDFSWITAGDYSLTLTAAAEGVPSSEATFEFTILDEDTLDAPTNIALDEDYNLTWDPVEGAESYTICIDGEIDTTKYTEFYLPNNFGFKWLDAGVHTLTLTATADGVPSAEVDYEFTVTEDMIPDIPEFIDLPDIHGVGENLTIQWTDCENVAYCWVDFDYSDDNYYETWTGDVEDASETTFVIPGSVFSRTGEGRVILWAESEFGIWRYTEGYFDICEILEILDAPVIHDISEVRVNTSYTFTWDAVENAENYYVEVNVPYDEDVYAEYKFDELLEDTSFTITLGTDDLPGAASITVSACAEGYASGSSTVEFEVLPVYGTLDAPVITFDNANEANEIYFGRDLNISWLTVENAEKYDLGLDRANGNNVTGTYTKEIAATIDQSDLLVLGEYVLTVKAQAPGWLDGVTTVTFTVVECPPLDAPVIEDIGDVYIGDDLTIRWSVVENAEKYKLDKYCWDDEDGWCLVVTSSTSTTTDTEMTFYGYTLGYDPGKWRVQVTAIAEDYQDGVSEYVYFNLLEKFTYRIVDGEAIITGYLPDDEYISAPGTLGGYPVTAIGDGAFESNKNITSVYLSDRVTSIGDAAFKNCTALESITGHGVTSIGDEAFAGCINLTNINLGDVKEVGENAFSGVNEDLFHWEISVDTSGTTISGYEGNWKIFKLEIGEGITTIAEKAFKNCINIQEIYLPTSLQRIESQAFAGCTSVNKVRLYEDCTYIADDVFNGDETVTFILYQRDVNAMSYARQYALDHNIPCTVLQWPTKLETPVVEWESKDYTVYKHVPVTIKIYAAKSDQVRMFMNGQDVGVYGVDANGNTSFSYTFAEEGKFDVYFRSEKDGEQISTPINTVTVLSQSISFTAPLDEAEISMAELAAAWTEVHGADHYEFSARYLDEENPFIFHQEADISGVTIPAEKIIGGKDLQLWVGAYNAAGTLICAETIQVKIKNTISFITPKQGETVDGEKALVLQWTEVYGADHYEYSARYMHQDSAFISNRDVNKATSQTIPVTQMLGEKELKLWVGAFDANDELICAETIQVNTSAVQELTISFAEPADEAILAYDENIAVGWTEVWLADHYRLSAKYENETKEIFNQKFARDIFSASLSSSILEKDKTLVLTIAACDEFDKILREETVQQSIRVFLAEETKETIGFVSPTKDAKVPYTEDLQVSWTEVESADHYVLYAAYEDTAEEYVYEREFTDERTGSIAMNLLKPGKNMQLTIKAYDAEGSVIAEKTITVSIQDIPPLDPIYLNVEQGQVLAATDDRFAFEWNEVDGADHYLFSLRDITDSSTEGELLYNQERIEVGAGNRLIASLTGGRRYRAWVCAVAPGKKYNDTQSSKFQVEFVYKIVPEFQVTGFEGNGKLNEGGTLSWTVPVAGNGDVITPDNYIIHIYFKENGTPVHSIEVDGTATSTVIDGSVFNQYGYYRIAVYATMYESWNGGYHSSADLDPHYTVGSPTVTASGILDGNTHVRNNVTRYTGTYTFWAAANDATEKVYAKRGSTVLNKGNSMAQDGTYGEDRRFILKNVSVPEGIHLYTFYTANGSQNQIKIYGVNKYITPQIKYANQDGVKVSTVPGGTAIGSLPINAEVVTYGELDVSSSEGYEYVLYEGSYYYVDKSLLGNEQIAIDVPIEEEREIFIRTNRQDNSFTFGDTITLAWRSSIEGKNLTGKLNVFYKNVGHYLNGKILSATRLEDGAWTITNTILDYGKEGSYFAKLEVFEGTTLVAEDTVYFTVMFDKYMSFLDGLNREDLELWLNNESPREDWDEYKKGGFLLLEETLDEKWGGWIPASMYTVYEYGLDILQLDIIGFVGNFFEGIDDDVEIEKILVENYVAYISSMMGDVAIAQKEESVSQELYGVYELLYDSFKPLYDKYKDDVIKKAFNWAHNEIVISTDMPAFEEMLKERKLTINEFINLHSKTKQLFVGEVGRLYDATVDGDWKTISEFIDNEDTMDTVLEAVDNKKIVQSRKTVSEVAKAFEESGDEFISFSNKMKRQEAIQFVVGGVVDMGFLAKDIYTRLKEKGVAVEKYKSYIQFIAEANQGYFDILDTYIASAKDSQQKQALETFKTDIQGELIDELANRFAEETVKETTENIVSSMFDMLFDMGIVIAEKICENKGITSRLLTSIKNYKGNLYAAVASIGIEIVGNVVKIDEKEEIRNDMLYYRDLKSALSDAILKEYDNYIKKNHHTPEKAAEIISALHYMKQLKYSGEYKALELIALITEVTKYLEEDPRWYIIYQDGSEWFASDKYVDVRDEVNQNIIANLQAKGYVVYCVRKDNVRIVSEILHNKNAALLSGVIDGIAGFYKIYLINKDADLITVEEAVEQTNQEVEAARIKAEEQWKKDIENSENYAWWVDYVENTTSKRIESLKIP